MWTHAPVAQGPRAAQRGMARLLSENTAELVVMLDLQKVLSKMVA